MAGGLAMAGRPGFGGLRTGEEAPAMKVAMFEAFRAPLMIRNVADPARPADGVVVKVEACGVCRSDSVSVNAPGSP